MQLSKLEILQIVLMTRIYYLQEIVKRPPRDIRIITIGDEPVAGMYRKSSGGFKTNIA